MNLEIFHRVPDQAHRDELLGSAGYAIITKMLIHYENLDFEVAVKTVEGLMDRQMLEMLDKGWKPDPTKADVPPRH